MRNVSVIIPSYNRPDDLDIVLPYYLKQDDIKEIIIIDDGSTISYERVMKNYSHIKDINIIYHKNPYNLGAGAGRNIGLSLASGKYILWGEDDAYPADNYVSVLKSKIDGKNIVFGSIYYGIYPGMSEKQKENIIISQQKANKQLFDYDLLEGYYRIKTKEDIEVPWGHALFMVEKTAYNNVHYFEGYKVNGYREETDAQVQMLKSGYSIVYTSDTCCYHFPAKNKKGGQHSSNIVKFAYYKIKNNNIFLERNYSFLQRKFGLTKSLMRVKCFFIINDFIVLVKKAVNRFLRGIKRK